ncbi:MAG: hypothetical protein DRP64_02410 [Verrucomicrobia bacterium]|nr:MAG: hypothetical protein DRP64_02410 [Verrucomicrobiota bacterium]
MPGVPSLNDSQNYVNMFVFCTADLYILPMFLNQTPLCIHERDIVMRFSVSKVAQHIFIAVCGFVYLGLGTMTAEAINYNDQGTTNYLGWATNDFRLKVGVDEPDNTLFITNGGIASVTEVYVGEISTSTGNLLSVTNGGLIIAGNANTNGLSTGGIVVGDTDGNGQLSVAHSSEVDTDYLYLGLGTNESGSIEIKKDGRLTVREQLIVGSAANSNNVMDVKTGGAVYINETSDLVINNMAGATNGFNMVNIESAGELLVGGDVNATTFTATSNLNFKTGSVLGVGGALTIDNSTIEEGLNIRLDDALSSNTSRWNTGEMYIGDTTGNNSLTLTNGATATATDIVYLGTKAASSGNSLNVEGTNSLLTAQDKILVGVSGDRNTLNITEGGQVTVAKDLKIGASSGSDNNSVSLGSNSVLTVANDVFVGANGDNNKFNIDQGQVSVANNFILGSGGINNRYNQTGGTNAVAGEFIIGETEDATGKTGHVDDDRVETTGNLAIVGKDATLDIQQNLTVGKEGGGSILTIRDGGTVNVVGDTVIGEAVGDNYIYLQRGSNTLFNVTSNLVVGKEGGSNRFAVYGGTANIGGDLFLGSTTNQHEIKNFIHVETTNAVIHVANALHIGASNSVNTLDLVGGATVTAQDLFVGAYEGTSNNVVTVTGNESLLYVTNDLAIGSGSGSDNAINVGNGGILYAQQDMIEIAGTNNTLEIRDGGTLQTLDWDFADMTGTATNILFQAGSTLELGGLLSGTNWVEGGIGFSLNGTNALWNTGTNVLYVGYETSDNTLTITNGAQATTTTNLYVGHDFQDNTVTVGGAGSLLEIGADLFIGTETDTSRFNTLEVLNGANVSVGNDAFLYRAATLKIDSSSQVTVAGDYEQDGFSTLEIGVSSNQVQPNLVVEGNAGFATSEDPEQFSLLKVFDDGIGESNMVNIVQAKTITVGGEAATTGSIYDNIQTNLLLGFNVTVSNGIDYSFIVLDDFIVRSIGEAADLEGQLLEISDEINDMKDAGNSNAVEMARIISEMSSSSEINTAFENYYGEKTSSAPMHNVINQGILSIATELTVRGDNTRTRMEAAAAPAGAAGPHTQNQGLQGWIAGYGTWGDKSASDGFDGYDSSLSGFIIGVDLAASQNILVGLAAGSNGGSVDKDNGASGDTKTTYGAVYASAGTKDWFLDGSMIYGASSIDNTLGEEFDTTASYDARNIAFYLGGGKEIAGEYLIITPQASLLANYYKQDAYDEEASNAVARSVDSFDALYLQSSLGCNLGIYMAMGKVTLKPELRAHWLHEFNAKEEDLANTLIGGTGGNYTMILQAPEADILRLGAGLAAKMSEYLELRADLDTRWGSNYSDYTLFGSLRYQF